MLNEHTPTKTPRGKGKLYPCVECAGIGERDPENCTHTPSDKAIKGRSAIRAIFDSNGRWLVHWREKDGEEWVGTYRLIPC